MKPIPSHVPNELVDSDEQALIRLAEPMARNHFVVPSEWPQAVQSGEPNWQRTGQPITGKHFRPFFRDCELADMKPSSPWRFPGGGALWRKLTDTLFGQWLEQDEKGTWLEREERETNSGHLQIVRCQCVLDC